MVSHLPSVPPLILSSDNGECHKTETREQFKVDGKIEDLQKGFIGKTIDGSRYSFD